MDLEDVNNKLDRLLLAVEGQPGDDNKPGLRIEVDRLKRTVSLQVKAFWLLLTTTAGVVAERLFHR